MQPGSDPTIQALGQRVNGIGMAARQAGISSRSVEDLANRLDQLLDQEIAKTNLKPACHKGCSWCCHRVVSATLGEVLQIALRIKKEFSKDAIRALVDRLHQYERTVAPAFGLNLENLRPTCPLLVDNECSIYAYRPLSCRTRHSFSIPDCERNAQNPDHPFPDDRQVNQIGATIEQGLSQSLSAMGLVSDPVDFARALLIALEDGQALDRWMKGDINFLPAIWRAPSPETEPPKAVPIQRTYGPGEEPTGHFDLTGLLYPNYLAMTKGDNRAAIEATPAGHPGYDLYRARVPLTYTTEEEILEWRSHFAKSVQALKNQEFDPRQAFDGLLAFRPHELVYQQFNNRDLLAEAGDLLCNHIAAKALPSLCEPIETRRKPGRPRVGFISQNLRSSSVSPWALGWLRNLGKKFETYAIHLGENQDLTSLEFQKLADHYFHMTPGYPVPAEARFIKNLDLDVLIYPDLGTNMRNTQMATLRLARNQMAAWGGPETSGLPSIDYYLSGELMEIETAQDHYSEELITFPGSGVCFERQNFPVSNLQKEDFGVKGPLVVCLQHAPKMEPYWDHLYLQINEATGSPIVFVDKAKVAADVVKARLTKAGVRAHYLPYLGLADYMGLIKCADVIVDTPGWNGGITTIHALQHGTPVVTLPTDLRRGRQSYCFLHTVGAPGLIATDQADFVDLITNPDRRQIALKDFNADAIFDDRQSVKGLADLIFSLVD